MVMVCGDGSLDVMVCVVDVMVGMTCFSDPSVSWTTGLKDL